MSRKATDCILGAEGWGRAQGWGWGEGGGGKVILSNKCQQILSKKYWATNIKTN